MNRTLTAVVVAPLVLPHEMGHALPAWLARLDWTVSVLPDYEGRQVPLGQFDAALQRTTPTWLIRLVAVAPLGVHLALAVALDLTLQPTSSVRVAAFPVVSFWATLSGGDLAVAASPDEARAAGAFVVAGAVWQERASTLLTLVVVLVVGFVLL